MGTFYPAFKDRRGTMLTLLILTALIASLDGKVLVSVITTTRYGHNCHMDDGDSGVVLTLTSPSHNECTTLALDSTNDDWEDGHTDVFSGDCLGQCRYKSFPNGLSSFVVQHYGGDGWCAGHVQLIFDNNSVETCVLNTFLDDYAHYTCWIQ